MTAMALAMVRTEEEQKKTCVKISSCRCLARRQRTAVGTLFFREDHDNDSTETQLQSSSHNAGNQVREIMKKKATIIHKHYSESDSVGVACDRMKP
ncbi:CLUMA_CG002289, isoform A [Clunio marinus]|uniref:CLUMA_CG002289, isoform A n=1 Tax=Clunio marinus TaxID=568069 RepID=A0A1J1HMB1_9DIPT|nr:CLUMA_CG002289, isoform A [Clunio marinus]